MTSLSHLNIHIASVFSPPVVYLLVQFFFKRRECLNFNEVQQQFFFYSQCFWCHIREVCLLQRHAVSLHFVLKCKSLVQICHSCKSKM